MMLIEWALVGVGLLVMKCVASRQAEASKAIVGANWPFMQQVVWNQDVRVESWTRLCGIMT